MRTYLVTGGAGFIGSNYIHYMFRKYGDQIRIINVDKLTYAGNLENLKDVEPRDNYTFVKADICLDKGVIIPRLHILQVLKVACISQLVHIDNPDLISVFAEHIVNII